MQTLNTDLGGAIVLEEQRGRFFCRRFVVHEAKAVGEIIARRVRTDVWNYGASLGILQPMELTETYDAYEGFHDPSDFPQVWR